jgi:hypothetical protein
MRHTSALHLGKGLSFVTSVLVLGACLIALGSVLSSNVAVAQGAACGTFSGGAISSTAAGDPGSASATNTACGQGPASAGATGGTNDTAVGFHALAGTATSFNTAIGANATTQFGSIAIGAGATVATSARASNTGAIAIGNNSSASGSNSTALGQDTVASFTNSTAIGAGATTTAKNQQMFGTASNSYTMAGINTTSTAAQSGPVKLVTADGAGTLGVSSLSALGIASTADIENLNGNIRKATEGVAMAFAMAGVPTVLPNEKFAATANWGTFDGENGYAFGAAMRLDKNWQLNAGAAGGVSGQTFGGRVGLRVGW